MARVPKAVREHQVKARAESMLRQRAREYHAAIERAEELLALPGADTHDADGLPIIGGDVTLALDRNAAVNGVALASKRLEQAALAFAERAPAPRRRRRRRA